MGLRLRFSLCALCVLCGDTPNSPAAPPTVEAVAPGVGQRGTTFTLTLTGARLADPQELLLYGPGVTCTKLAAADENEVTLTLQAAPDCRLGEYPFRLRTAGGASELKVFRITPLPVVAEREPNDSPKQAQAVPLNVSVAGVIESAGTDCYAVTLKKGQRLAAEVEAVRLGGEFTDAVLAVFGPDGKELAHADDTPLFRQDPFVTVVAPADGVYVVRVRETILGGSDSSRYVLHVGTFCRPQAIFPAGGPAGARTEVNLLGDAAGERTVPFTPAAGATEFYPADEGGPAPTPHPFRASPFPNVLEGDKAVAAWPVAFNGIIAAPGEVDDFRFKAAAGDVIDVEAFAYRIGSPLDPVVTVFDAAGKPVAGGDDDETHDSRAKVVIPAAGEYVLRVADKRKAGGPRFVYRVELAKPVAGLAVFLPTPARKSADRQVVTVPRGGRSLVYLAVRRDGVDGPATITPGDLPEGVTANVPPVPPGEYLVPVVVEASAGAPLGGKLVGLTGTCGGVTGGFSQVVTLSQGPGDSAYHATAVDKLAVVVTEEAPFSVAVLPPATAAPVDGTLDLMVKLTRAKDFSDPVEVFFPWLPPGTETPASVVIPGDQSEAVVTLVAHPAAEPGDWKLVAEAKVAAASRVRRDPQAGAMPGMDPPPAGAGGAGGRGRRRRSAEGLPPVASNVVPLAVAAAPVKGAFKPAAGEQGKAAAVVCTLDLPAGLAGPFTAKLDGLPPRTVAPLVEVPAGAKQVTFAVAVDKDTPPTPYPSLVCELAGEAGGRKVVYRVGRGGVLTVNPPGGGKTDAAGKPLSPLEALRHAEKKP